MTTERKGGLLVLLAGAAIDAVNYAPMTSSAVEGLKKSGGTGALVADWLLSPALALVLFIIGIALFWRGGKPAKNHGPDQRGDGVGGGNRDVTQQQTGSGFQIGGDVHGNVHVGPQPPSVSKPEIKFSRFGEAQLFKRIIAFVLGGPPVEPEPKYYVCQAWFTNEGAETARQLNAFISVENAGVRMLGEVRGSWAITNAPENVAFNDVVTTWPELAPNGDEVKLLVVLRWPGEQDAYIWVDGGKEYPGRRHPSYRLPIGIYTVVIRIRGANGVDRHFVFALDNPIGGHPKLTGPHARL